MALALWELAKHPKFQEMLRAEIHSSLGEDHRNDVYDKMPLLNAFIKVGVLCLFRKGSQILLAGNIEVLSGRSIHGANSRPRHGYSATGEQVSQIPVSRGQIAIVGVASYHRFVIWMRG
jgi:hypothetical protein